MSTFSRLALAATFDFHPQMAAKGPPQVSIAFELIDDQFEHAWFFNRFRVDKIGASHLITFCLSSEPVGNPAVNAVVLSANDLESNKERALTYLSQLQDIVAKEGHALSFSSPPQRIYPVNHMNIARVDQMAEIGFFRFSVNTLADRLNQYRVSKKIDPIHCYPVVMFRSDVSTQVALLKALYGA